MSIVKAKTNQYGPGTLDVQVEQGADFTLTMSLTKGGATWDLTGATFDAHMSTEWSPGGNCVEWAVTLVGLATAGTIKISFPVADQSVLVSLPSPPPKTSNPTPFQLGDWVLNVTQDGETVRLVSGKVFLARDPCLS